MKVKLSISTIPADYILIYLQVPAESSMPNARYAYTHMPIILNKSNCEHEHHEGGITDTIPNGRNNRVYIHMPMYM